MKVIGRSCASAIVAALVSWPPGFAPAQAAEAGMSLEGRSSQGGLLRGRVAPGSTVTLDGAPVRDS